MSFKRNSLKNMPFLILSFVLINIPTLVVSRTASSSSRSLSYFSRPAFSGSRSLLCFSMPPLIALRPHGNVNASMPNGEASSSVSTQDETGNAVDAYQYYNFSTSNSSIQISVYSALGDSWSTPVDFDANNNYSPQSPLIAQNNTGSALILWQIPSAVYYVNQLRGVVYDFSTSSFGSAFTISSSTESVLDYYTVNASLSDGGTVAISWISEDSSGFTYSKAVNGSLSDLAAGNLTPVFISQ
jgi:hypothetical protein